MPHLQQIDDEGRVFTAADGAVRITVLPMEHQNGYWGGVVDVVDDERLVPVMQLQETAYAAALMGATSAMAALQFEGTGHQKLRRAVAFREMLAELNVIREASGPLPKAKPDPKWMT